MLQHVTLCPLKISLFHPTVGKSEHTLCTSCLPVLQLRLQTLSLRAGVGTINFQGGAKWFNKSMQGQTLGQGSVGHNILATVSVLVVVTHLQIHYQNALWIFDVVYYYFAENMEVQMVKMFSYYPLSKHTSITKCFTLTHCGKVQGRVSYFPNFFAIYISGIKLLDKLDKCCNLCYSV